MESKNSYLGWNLDFSEPRGEASLCAPDSVAWKVYKNPVSMVVGGIAAVLLEFADARIRSGVWDHSVYRVDPLGRSRRTGIAAMVGVYGPESVARRIIRGVNNMHAKVSGSTPNGEAYSAQDPELLDWVSATASYGFLTAYDRFVRPVPYDDQCRFYEEAAPIAALYGVQTPLRRPEDFEAMYQALLPRFEPHTINIEFLDIIKSGKAAAQVPKSLYSAAANAAVSILPGNLRRRLDLGRDYDLTTAQRLFIGTAARLADVVPITRSPAGQAATRLGLPASFAWQSDRRKASLLRSANMATSRATH